MIEPLLEDEMIERLHDGEDPLDLAIEKYERLLEIVENGGKIDVWWVMSDCCPLCHEYCCDLDFDEEYDVDHMKCPLEIFNDRCCNSDSTWESVRTSINANEFVVISIKKMLEKLKWIKSQETRDE